MGGVGDEDFAAGIALGLVPGANQKDAGELAVGAGGGLEGDRVHAGDVEEAALEQAEDFENALGERVGTVGVGFGEAFDAGDQLVNAGVVLHGAGAEGVHAEIYGVVPGGEAGEVANDLDLAQFRQQPGRLAVCVAKQRRRVNGWHVKRRHLVGALAGRGFLEE